MNSVSYKYDIGETIWCIDKNKILSAFIEDVNIHVSKAGYKVNYSLCFKDDSYPSVFKQEENLFLTKEALIKSL